MPTSSHNDRTNNKNNYGAKMKITDKVFIMPKVEQKYLNRAKKTELKVLYGIFMNGGNTGVDFLSKVTEESADSIMAALAFWRCAGVIDDDDAEETVVKPETKEIKKDEDKPSDVKPQESYTLKEIAEVRERDSNFGSLVSYFEKLSGHLYNSAEQGIVLYLYDTLGIDCELIMGVAQYCASLGKNSVRYIEKTVLNITEQGVSTYAELESYLEKQKKTSEFADMVKKIIGAKDRALTKAENIHISKWHKEFGCSEELVAYAYEKTVAKINKPQISYMSKILESWYEKGLKTPEEVDRFFANPDNTSKEPADGRLNFNLDDIFEQP